MKEKRGAAFYLWKIPEEGWLGIALLLLTFMGMFVADVVRGSLSLLIKTLTFIIFVIVLYALVAREEKVEMAFAKGKQKASIPVPQRDNVDTVVNFTEKLAGFCREILDIIKTTFFAHSAMVFLLDKEADLLRLEYMTGESENLVEGDSIGTGLPATVLKTKNPVMEGDLPTESLATDYYRQKVGIRSFLGVPLLAHDTVFGVLAVDSKVQGAFGQEDCTLLQSYASLLSNLIATLSERQKLDFMENVATTYYDLSIILRNDSTCEQLLDALAEACKRIFHFDRLTISLKIGDQNEATIKKVVGQVDDFPEGYRFDLYGGLNGWLLLKNKPLVLPDTEKGEFFRPRYSKEEKTNFGLRSFLGVPIAYREETLGAVTLESKKPLEYKESDQRILLTLVGFIALALHRSLAGGQIDESLPEESK